MQKIVTYLWFDHQAEEAMNYYLAIFPNSKVVSVSRYGDEVPGLAGMVMTAHFQLAGEDFMALNGGPHFHFSEAISLFVNCDDQNEVDMLWEKLSAGGEEQPCGWLKDKYGLSWQIIPRALGELMGDPDPVKASRVGQAMMTMTKIDIAGLRRAYEGG